MGFLNSSGLSRFLGKILELLDGKVNINQGSRNEGCYLVVDEDGQLALQDVPVCVGIPDELDRIGRVRVTGSNASGTEFPFILADEDVGLEPYCTYVGSVHVYMSGAEYVSDLDLAEYQETQAGTDMLCFANSFIAGSTVFRFFWKLDPDEEKVKLIVYGGESLVRIDSLFSTSNFTRIELIVRKAQAEPY